MKLKRRGSWIWFIKNNCDHSQPMSKTIARRGRPRGGPELAHKLLEAHKGRPYTIFENIFLLQNHKIPLTPV
jgi:hypothetical protein